MSARTVGGAGRGHGFKNKPCDSPYAGSGFTGILPASNFFFFKCVTLVDSQVWQSIRLSGDFSSVPFSDDWVIWSQDMMLSLVDLVLLHGCMVLLKNCKT